jgi:hypothetical protein
MPLFPLLDEGLSICSERPPPGSRIGELGLVLEQI